jgi:hypothetical protein
MHIATLLGLTLLLCSCATPTACRGELRPINPAASAITVPRSIAPANTGSPDTEPANADPGRTEP